MVAVGNDRRVCSPNRLGNRGQEAQTVSCTVAMSEAVVQPCPSVEAVSRNERPSMVCAEEVLSTEQALVEWLCVKHLELRVEIGDLSVVAELIHLLAAGAVKMQTLGLCPCFGKARPGQGVSHATEVVANGLPLCGGTQFD